MSKRTYHLVEEKYLAFQFLHRIPLTKTFIYVQSGR